MGGRSYIVIVHGKQETKLPIIGDKKLVSQVILDWLGTKRDFKPARFHLSDFREMNVVNFDKQVKLKDYLDDLVFSLYFDIKLEKSHISNPKKVRKACIANEF